MARITDEIKKKARDMYIIEGKSVQEVATKLDVSKSTVNSWATKNKWTFIRGSVKDIEYSSELLDYSEQMRGIYEKALERSIVMVGATKTPKQMMELMTAVKIIDERMSWHYAVTELVESKHRKEKLGIK